MNKLFRLIRDLPEDAFRAFLLQLDEADVACYNRIQKEILDKKRLKFSGNAQISKAIEQRRKQVQFDRKRMMSSLVYLKDNISGYMEKMKHTYGNRERFYSGMVCSMCSPKFSNQFKLNQNGAPEMEINQRMCNRVILERIEFIISLEIFPFVQKIVDLAFCARTNSKPEKNYCDLKWTDLNLIIFDMEVFPGEKISRNKCIQEDEAYFGGSPDARQCTEFCQNSLNFFELKMVSMDKFIRVENELHNMFFRTPEMLQPPLKRLHSNIRKYDLQRDKLVDSGLLEYQKDSQLEKIWYLKNLPEAPLEFKKTQITVSEHLGVCVADTQMNPEYYATLIALINFTWLFGLIFSI